MRLFKNVQVTAKSLKICLLVLALLSLFSVSSLFLTLVTHKRQTALTTQAAKDLPLTPLIAESERIYVISLQHRDDRRADMEELRSFLRIPNWTYIFATGAGDEIVSRIMKNVRILREWLPFQWPSFPKTEKAGNSTRDSALLTYMAGFDMYQLPIRQASSRNPLVISAHNFTLMPYMRELGKHRIISPSRVACWHSHLRVIRQVAEDPAATDITIILEDDVDMEIDIRKRLSHLWGLLPTGWDIVFLGHCWSNERKRPPLVNSSCSASECYAYPNITNDNSSSSSYDANSLHPSHSPQCTHAYALSPRGAKKLFDRLTYPPFAYSRAIDQAFSWLVKSGRINAFSVVPAVVVQRAPQHSGWLSWLTSPFRKSYKESDIWNTKSRWRDRLVNGVFGTSDEEGSWWHYWMK
ncbi:hypothetical protein L218DRAFT_857825 [Marasmius fiardii PR-910]|nr:hypothetical protein L218DRAFT_857825 [Marasmius fiardii PR-910]